MNACRLPQATLFDLGRVLWLPWSEKWFECRPGNPSPFVGYLPSSYMARLEAIRIQRQVDSAAEHSANDLDDDDDDDDDYGDRAQPVDDE